jgi:16S rRNA (adenine1518-N6/adenine1519-N6)-dimethyltransferase
LKKSKRGTGGTRATSTERRKRPAHRPRKRFAQHFLERPWIDRLIAALAPRAEDVFVEIGPGRGALTLALAPHVRHIVAIEIDRDLAAELSGSAPPNVEIVEGDILKQDLAALVAGRDAHLSGSTLRIVGNLPYNISSPVLFQLLRGSVSRGLKRARYGEREKEPVRQQEPAGGERAEPMRGLAFRDATLMLQREVADRLLASAGSRDYGRLTVLAALHADVVRLFDLPPGAFRPAPAVHSSVVRLAFRPPTVDVGELEAFDELVRTLFSQRRKTLVNALRPYASARALDAAVIVRAAGLDGTRRPETLDLGDLARLAGAIRGSELTTQS